jgi:hypothetical protein
MNRILIVFIFIVTIITICESVVLLYNTENSDSIEEYDCIYYTKISTDKYCARPGGKKFLSRNMNTCLNGKRWNFSELLSNEISPGERR